MKFIIDFNYLFNYEFYLYHKGCILIYDSIYCITENLSFLMPKLKYQFKLDIYLFFNLFILLSFVIDIYWPKFELSIEYMYT